MFLYYRTDQYEEYFEDEEEVEIENEEVVFGVVAPQLVNFPLKVVVGPVAGSPDSPSPSPSPPTPSPPLPSAPQGSPLGVTSSCMGFYSYDDVVDLEQWAMDARATRENPNIGIEEQEVSPT